MYKCRCPYEWREPAMQMSYTTTRQMRSIAAQKPYTALSREAQMRYRWILWHLDHGGNKSLTCRHFAISRPTLDKWLKRYKRRHLQTLEDLPKTPARKRRPEWTTNAVIAVRDLREQYPRWGKKKLVVLLRRVGWTLSESTVGRIISYLRKSGQLHYYCKKVQMRWKRSKRPWAIRKPKDYGAKSPGDILQIDTVDLRPVPGVIYKQLSATDVVSRWAALEVKSRATARVTRDSIKEMLLRIPFPIRAIQIDGGSEFMAEFEEYCRNEELRLYVLPPHSPKLNGRVERFNRTSREEFHEVSNVEVTVRSLNQAAREWEVIYNTIRPHESLGQLTPEEFINIHYPKKEVAA